MAFDDPQLEGLIDEALRDNFTLRTAWGRLQASRAVVRRENASLFPWLEGFAGGEVGTDQPLEGTQRVPLQFGVAASYEIDLWGRIRADIEADRQRREASHADYQAAALALSAEVARAWYGLGAARAQLELLDAQVEANERIAELVQARFRTGQARRADLLRQRQLLEATRSVRIDQAARVEVLEHRLAVLLGRSPQQGVGRAPGALPAVPPLPDTGVPLELIRRRPDVRSAHHRLRAADAEVAVAVSNKFPRLDLGASLAKAADPSVSLFEAWVGSLSASLVAPLFEAGRRQAEVERTRAVEEQRLYEYGTAILTAFQEVEDALARDRAQAERIASLEEQVSLGAEGATRLRDQFSGGMVGYIDVLEATTTEQQLRRDLIEARLVHLERRIDLYRALAGGFETEREAADE